MRVLPQAFLRNTEVGPLKNKATSKTAPGDEVKNDVVLTATPVNREEPVASLRPALRPPTANAPSGHNLKHAVAAAHRAVYGSAPAPTVAFDD